MTMPRLRAAFLVFAIAACAPAGAPASPEAGDAATLGATATALASLPSLAQLADGWNMLRPGGDTLCAQGTEYAFFVRRGRTDRLLVFLQGGGACWSLDTCDPDGEPIYVRDVDDSDNPANRAAGIFDLGHPDNPVADYSMVMIPYCTGDVHVGDRSMTYVDMQPGGGKRVTVNHRGWVNGQAVLRWVFDNFEAPAQVVVAGTSAGSIPAPLYAQLVAERWPASRVVALGDASGAYRREAIPEAPMFEMWGTADALRQVPGYESMPEPEMTFRQFYINAAAHHPALRLLRYDAAEDAVQAFYLRKAGNAAADVHALLQQEASDIRAAAPSLRTFVGGGPTHGILPIGAFYSYEVDGLRFRDWFAAAVAGEPVDDVQCSDCSRPTLHGSAHEAEILERAAALLGDETSWNRRDDRDCRDDAQSRRFSLGCAVQSEGQGSGSATFVAAEALRFAFPGTRPGSTDAVLVEINNDPAVTHAQVLAAFAAAAAGLRAHAHE